MPEGYTHVRIAQKAAHAIHYKLQCPAAFAAGANGPDSFFWSDRTLSVIRLKEISRFYDI